MSLKKYIYICTRNQQPTKRFKIENFAGVAKLVDVPDLGSGVARRVGSSPITRTKPLIFKRLRVFILEFNQYLGSSQKRIKNKS